MHVPIPPLILGFALQILPAQAAPSTWASCRDIPAPNVPGAVVKSVTSRAYQDHSVTASSPTLLQDVSHLNICEVNVTLSHYYEDDVVLVQTWLPLHGWNSRYVAIGGGAWLAGLGSVDLALPASQGYAVSSTDAGLSGNAVDPSAWALKPDGTVNTGLLTNFASRSIHDMALVGKSVTAAFYKKPAKHAFFNGCSTGGRQGLAAAQSYPEDFDGILAGAPAIYWTEYVIAELWPQVVMREADYYLSACEADAFVEAAVKACDGADGVKDGVITHPLECHFDPFTLVGRKVQCDKESVKITRKAASIVSNIWAGPTTSTGKKLWYGMLRGASLNPLANTKDVNGTTVGDPFFVADTWVRDFVKADPTFDTTQLDSASLESLFYQSKDKFSHIMDSANPNLSLFKRAGGKLVIWHGLADQLIYPQDSIKYVEEVKQNLKQHGETCAVTDFLRLFLAPGVDHCGYAQSSGAVPTDPFGALVAWVEKGKAPQSLAAHTKPDAPAQFSRKLCPYPLVAEYKGKGDPKVAESYACVVKHR
ncbi:Tannase/feruloyl esterase [Dactylonectria macrodidyma]|uniref:Carboxylic ester hydrolase n=1 Tax=Dactylonectria macrodidyma TaxID=307937 RepID=A0A9P9J0E8_9HYPO|nr:Tannase/feruloyl esterase [Dactylonectria macrodidyma]